MSVSQMKHDEIADFCVKKLRSMGLKFSCSNLTSATNAEQPDVLGINAQGESILIEVKTSRADFFADKKKPWRLDSELGIGDFRVYLTPKDLIKTEEVPYGWMLWEVHGKKKPIIKIIKGKARKMCPEIVWDYVNCDVKEYFKFKKSYESKNCRAELAWMIKVMGRAIDDGFEPNNYANCFQEKQTVEATPCPEDEVLSYSQLHALHANQAEIIEKYQRKTEVLKEKLIRAITRRKS